MPAPLPKKLLGVALAAGLLAAPGVAEAATVSYDGATAKVVGTEGADSFQYSVYEGELILSGSPMIAGAGCTGDDSQYEVKCPVPANGVEIQALGGVDNVRGYLSDQPAGFARVDLGAGDDKFETYGGDSVVAGAGNDELTGLGTGMANTFEGGAGNDKLLPGSGRDVVRGGDGDDVVDGNAFETFEGDVIDGGAGRDTIDDWAHPDAYDQTPATVTLDGVADDGFPGEGDNVTNVESIRSNNGIVFRGTDAPEQVVAGEVGGKGSMKAMGGDDQLQGSDDDETIDGGAGNDDIRAGYGNDTIAGGPGTDKIVADRDGRCNELHCDISPGSAADTVDAVDGERDTIACGPGNDTVRADAIDDVAPDCEAVTRAGGSGAGPEPVADPGADPGTPRSASVAVSVKGARTLRALRTGKLRLTVRGARPGAAVKVRVLRGAKLVASGRARADTAGAATVRLKATKAGRRAKAGRFTVVALGRRSALRLAR
jgi:Ca2+-binding RTX toxin-like protein